MEKDSDSISNEISLLFNPKINATILRNYHFVSLYKKEEHF